MPLNLEITSSTVRDILLAIGGLVIVGIVVRIIQRLIWRYVDEPEKRYAAGRMVRRIGGLIALLVVITVFTPGQKNLVAVLTVIGAGLAIAMREALLSFVGWLHLVVRNPYRQGDRIEINGLRGDVLDIRLLHTTVMELGAWVGADQSTGRIAHFPNAWLFQFAVMNYNRGFNFIWNELTMTVTRTSDWEAAREIMLSIAQESAGIVEQQAATEIRRMSRDYLIHYSILTPFVYVSLSREGILLTLRYLCEARKRRGTEHAFTISLLAAFATHGNIELV